MSRLSKVLVGLLSLLVVIGAAAWWLGLFGEPEEEVSIEAARAAAQAAEGVEGVEDDASGEPVADASEAPVTDLTGTWTIVGGGSSFVGYRIDEVLNTVGDFTVVGRTEEVTGSIVGDETTVASADLIADMTTLTTDNGGRDGAMRNQALETSQFPEATFSLTTPIELDAIPAEGQTIDVTASGDLTIHGVTRSVDFPLTATIEGASFVVIGQLGVLLADYDISAPSAPIVASVEDNAVLELSLVFQRP